MSTIRLMIWNSYDSIIYGLRLVKIRKDFNITTSILVPIGVLNIYKLWCHAVMLCYSEIHFYASINSSKVYSILHSRISNYCEIFLNALGLRKLFLHSTISLYIKCYNCIRFTRLEFRSQIGFRVLTCYWGNS